MSLDNEHLQIGYVCLEHNLLESKKTILHIKKNQVFWMFKHHSIGMTYHVGKDTLSSMNPLYILCYAPIC